MSTPCKVWDPHGKSSPKKGKNADKVMKESTPGKKPEATPKKVKERRKREAKALQALMKLKRQKQLLTHVLNDLTEPQDEGKMILV
jgi:hypothetical protein